MKSEGNIIKRPDVNGGYVEISSLEAGQRFSTLKPDVLISLYKEFGAVLFRGFHLDLESLNVLTSMFCDSFIPNNIEHRDQVSDDGRTQTVNLQNVAFPLHSEMTQVPHKPDLACFACVTPPDEFGETVICDGTLVHDLLRPETADYLCKQSLLYKLVWTPQMAGAFLSSDELVGSSFSRRVRKGDLSFWVENGQIIRGYSYPVFNKTIFSKKNAFANLLLFSRYGVKCKDYPVFDSGELISDVICDELKAVTDSISIDHRWQKNDVIILDNTRFMHGRRKIVDSSKRVIWTQFGYINFHPEGGIAERMSTKQ